MRTSLAIILSLASPAFSLIISTAGFSLPTYTLSSGGKAQCVQGYIPVTASATNEKILLAEPANQFVVNQLLVDYLSVDSNVSTTVNGGSRTVSGTYNINAKLCYPILALSAPSTVVFLIHGIGYDKSYWDLASSYSFIDAAAAAGYATFSYDRLGTGLSDHPDPIQTVQSTLQVSIAHALIQLLRAGSLSAHSFPKVAGAGHSYGSIQTVGIAASYPTDLDAIILQGFSTSTAALGLTFAAFNPSIAAQDAPARLAALPTGYLVTGTAVSDALAFFTYPNFDTSLFAAIDAAKQPFSLGDFLTLANVVAVAPAFTGPVDVVLGERDFIFCQGECAYPVNQAALVRPELFPAASVAGSQIYIVGGTGHAVNAHYNATKAFAHMTGFLKANGL